MQYVSRETVENAIHKIFFNPDVIKQLEQSNEEAESEYITNYEEYLMFKDQVANEPK